MSKIPPENTSVLSQFYQALHVWLDDVKQHELTQVIDLIEHAKKYMVAAELIPAEKVKQFVDNFSYDLAEFYHQTQQEMKHSVYIGLLNETLWQRLAGMTDKSQVEWSELVDDFYHGGLYRQGDYVGFGKLICRKCKHSVTINHLSEVSCCAQCKGEEFIRRGLGP
jgi:hypothetical protein